MQWDTWYDLSIRELSDRTDPAKEKLNEAEETAATSSCASHPDEEDEQPAGEEDEQPAA